MPHWGRGPVQLLGAFLAGFLAYVSPPARVATWGCRLTSPCPVLRGGACRYHSTKRCLCAAQRPVHAPCGRRAPLLRSPQPPALIFLVHLALPGTLLIWWPEGRGRPHHSAGCWRRTPPPLPSALPLGRHGLREPLLCSRAPGRSSWKCSLVHRGVLRARSAPAHGGSTSRAAEQRAFGRDPLRSLGVGRCWAGSAPGVLS